MTTKDATAADLKPMPDEITVWIDSSGSMNLHKSFGNETAYRYVRAELYDIAIRTAARLLEQRADLIKNEEKTPNIMGELNIEEFCDAYQRSNP